MKKANYTYTVPQRLKRTENDIARFWKWVDRRGPDDCWLWIGSKGLPNPCGMVYGNFGVTLTDGRSYSYRAHRFAWMLSNGQLPKGLVVMHRCDTPLCCNPSHLKAGTQADNLHDRDAKGRQLNGERHNMVVLSEAQVRKIYLTPRSISHVELAKQYPVTHHAIWAIRRGRTWRHITSKLCSEDTER